MCYRTSNSAVRHWIALYVTELPSILVYFGIRVISWTIPAVFNCFGGKRRTKIIMQYLCTLTTRTCSWNWLVSKKKFSKKRMCSSYARASKLVKAFCQGKLLVCAGLNPFSYFNLNFNLMEIFAFRCKCLACVSDRFRLSIDAAIIMLRWRTIH